MLIRIIRLRLCLSELYVALITLVFRLANDADGRVIDVFVSIQLVCRLG